MVRMVLQEMMMTLKSVLNKELNGDLSPFNNKGFSISEVLIALLIFSIVALSFFFVLSFSFKIEHKNNFRLFASKFAEEKMIFIKHNRKNYIKKINQKTIPSLKEKISEEDIKWQITDIKKIKYQKIVEIKIESLSPLLIHTRITIKWTEKEKEKQFILESYL